MPDGTSALRNPTEHEQGDEGAFERAQQAIGEAEAYGRTAMFTEWSVEYGMNPEARDLSTRIKTTQAEARSYFGHEKYFDYRGMTLHPKTSGIRLGDLPGNETDACMATTLVLAGTEHADAEQLLIDMRAFALARDEAREMVSQGKGSIFTHTGSTRLATEAERFRAQAEDEVRAESNNVTGCLGACQGIRGRIRQQVEEKSEVDRKIEERKDREETERQKELARIKREAAKETLDKVIDLLQNHYGTPIRGLSDSEGI